MATTVAFNPLEAEADEQHSSEHELIVSVAEAMNPSKRPNNEDVHVTLAPGTWSAPDPDMAYLAVYDGHGGRDMVDFLEHGLNWHVARELHAPDDSDMKTRLERAFLMCDIHARQAGIMSSGATAAICLVTHDPQDISKVTVTAANTGDARIVIALNGQGAVRLTNDHNSQDPLEVARIEQSGGFLFKNRVLGILAITRSFGDQMLKK
jgi:serine/threonine protein phosphatase PrpC